MQLWNDGLIPIFSILRRQQEDSKMPQQRSRLRMLSVILGRVMRALSRRCDLVRGMYMTLRCELHACFICDVRCTHVSETVFVLPYRHAVSDPSEGSTASHICCIRRMMISVSKIEDFASLHTAFCICRIGTTTIAASNFVYSCLRLTSADMLEQSRHVGAKQTTQQQSVSHAGAQGGQDSTASESCMYFKFV